jgi:hypothetical protein
MNVKQIASAVLSHIYDGLKGAVANIAVSQEQLEDEVVAERNTIIKEYLIKGVANLQEVYSAINCVEVKCASMSKCCELGDLGQKALHFEIPPVLLLSGVSTIKFIGSIDQKEKYQVYTNNDYKYHQYKKRGANKPYVYLDTTVNSNGMIDGYIFNAPLVKMISVVAVFLDPRKLVEFNCCADEEIVTDCGIISNDIVHRLTQKYAMWYRQSVLPPIPNTQSPL